MRATAGLGALAASISTAAAVSQGFNYGSTFTDGSARQQSDFESLFTTAQQLVGAPGNGFTSARLYTMVQGATPNTPISAIPAAIKTSTHLLLGMWASAGDAAFANELQALKSAISTYGSSLGGVCDGISVGSEDLYRISPIGIQNNENPGAQPSTIIGYIKQVRDAIANTPLAGCPVGHVDTWTAWVNSSNSAVASASDWVGVDAYPYFQNTMANSITDGKALFDSAIGQTQAAVGGKPVWVTETGFPVSGKTVNLAIPSLDNAKTYWDQVGCPLFGSTNVWWYTLQDASPSTPNPSFGIVGNPLSTTPLFDISCKNITSSSSSSSSAAPTSTTSSGGSSNTVTSGSATATGSATTVGSSSSASSAVTSAVTSAVPSIGGGSPGATGLPASQSSIESATITTGASKPTGSSSSTTGSGSGSGAGSSSGAGSGSGTGSGSSTASGSGTASGTSTTSSKPSIVTSGAGTVSGPMGAVFAAAMGAVLAL